MHWCTAFRMRKRWRFACIYMLWIDYLNINRGLTQTRIPDICEPIGLQKRGISTTVRWICRRECSAFENLEWFGAYSPMLTRVHWATYEHNVVNMKRLPRGKAPLQYETPWKEIIDNSLVVQVLPMTGCSNSGTLIGQSLNLQLKVVRFSYSNFMFPNWSDLGRLKEPNKNENRYYNSLDIVSFKGAQTHLYLTKRSSFLKVRWHVNSFKRKQFQPHSIEWGGNLCPALPSLGLIVVHSTYSPAFRASLPLQKEIISISISIAFIAKNSANCWISWLHHPWRQNIGLWLIRKILQWNSRNGDNRWNRTRSGRRVKYIGLWGWRHWGRFGGNRWRSLLWFKFRPTCAAWFTILQLVPWIIAFLTIISPWISPRQWKVICIEALWTSTISLWFLITGRKRGSILWHGAFNWFCIRCS